MTHPSQRLDRQPGCRYLPTLPLITYPDCRQGSKICRFPRMLRTPGDASVWEQHGSIKRDRRHVPLASLLNLSIFVKFWKDFQNFGNIFLWVFQKSIAAPLGSRCISRVFYVPDPVTPSPWPGGGGRTVVSREGTVRPSAPVRVQVKYFSTFSNYFIVF